MGSQLPPSYLAGESSKETENDQLAEPILPDSDHVVSDSSDQASEKLMQSSDASIVQQDAMPDNVVITSESTSVAAVNTETAIVHTTSAGLALIPAEKRVNGQPMGTVLDHVYTDNNNTNLEQWLPQALNQTRSKREILLHLEKLAIDFINNNNEQYLLLKAPDSYHRLAIYRVMAYFGLSCRAKDNDLLASKTEFTRIPEEELQFESMLIDLQEDATNRPSVESTSDVHAVPVYAMSSRSVEHLQHSPMYFHRGGGSGGQFHIPSQQQPPARFRNHVPHHYQHSFPPHYGAMSPSPQLPMRGPPPLRRQLGPGPRGQRHQMMHPQHLLHQHGGGWIMHRAPHNLPQEMYENDVSRSRSVPDVISSEQVDSVQKATTGVQLKSCDNPTATDIYDCTSKQPNDEFHGVQENSSLSDNSTKGGGDPPVSNEAGSNKDAAAQSSQIDTDSEASVGASQQMAALTIEHVTRKEHVIPATGPTHYLLQESNGGQVAFEHIAAVAMVTSGNYQHHPVPQPATSPIRAGVVPYPPPTSVARPATLAIYGGGAAALPHPTYTPSQPTVLMVADPSHTFMQPASQVGHGTYALGAVAANGSNTAETGSPSVVPVIHPQQPVMYIAPPHQQPPPHQPSSVIYLNPLQPNPVISRANTNSGITQEYITAGPATPCRELPAGMTTVGATQPPPAPAPHVLYVPSYPQPGSSLQPPSGGGLMYYTTPSGEILYAVASGNSATPTAATLPPQQNVSQEYIQYQSNPSLSTVSVGGYTISPYIANQQPSQPPANTSFVNYYPTAGAVSGPAVYAASTPLVFQATPSYSIPPPPGEMTRVPMESPRPAIQWVPFQAGAKGAGYMSGLHFSPASAATTPTRPLNVADVQLIGQPITVHPIVQIPANQRMDMSSSGAMITGINNPSPYRLQQQTHVGAGGVPAPYKQSFHGIRSATATFRSMSSPGVTIAPTPRHYQ